MNRFWEKTIPEPMSGCWLWMAGERGDGYGVFNLNGRIMGSHRAAWELTRGRPPHGMHVLHKCDNRACVNPEHLFLGTNLDNISDRSTKGRSARGEKHGQAKLTEDVVRVVRARYGAGGITQRALAKDMGLSCGTVAWILSGGWAHVK